MKSLTLLQLRKAIDDIYVDKQLHGKVGEGTLQYLLSIRDYMISTIPGQGEPLDPRDILTAFGYQW